MTTKWQSDREYLDQIDSIVHSLFEFSGHLIKFTVIKELIETPTPPPPPRWQGIVVRRVVQPVREHSLTTLLIVHSLTLYHTPQAIVL